MVSLETAKADMQVTSSGNTPHHSRTVQTAMVRLWSLNFRICSDGWTSANIELEMFIWTLLVPLYTGSIGNHHTFISSNKAGKDTSDK